MSGPRARSRTCVRLDHSSLPRGGSTIPTVKPQEAFLRYFQPADGLARRREKKRGVKSGSDRSRTRDLRSRYVSELWVSKAWLVTRFSPGLVLVQPRVRGETCRGVRSVRRGNNGNAHGSLGPMGSAASARIPANWQFQRTGATGRERSPMHRTQEVAASSPASSTQSGSPLAPAREKTTITPKSRPRHLRSAT